jgi:DNA mismatch endonuclease, patch repair protein
MNAPKLKPRSKRQPLHRSEMMARIGSTNTTPEYRTGSALHAMGLRFRKNVKQLPGRPDFANQTRRWAIFVHGCFWHCHQGCSLASSPKTNRGYWVPKLQRNVERDAAAARGLRAAGYQVFIVWECETRDSAMLEQRLRNINRSIGPPRLAVRKELARLPE